ncbi:hypothetical protein LBMAG42_49230 [Deltaproteobacteria bacterium]|nr:hypothetical protein LBMAG42_49230 [Deltaproteobacteria bacterium]
MRGALQVLVDCPACRVECALVELIDPSSPLRLGRCRLCAHETANGETLTPGKIFVSSDEVEEALIVWASAEGELLDVFVESNFGGLDTDGISAAILRGDRIATSFDVVAWLFKDRTGGMVALGASGEAGDRGPRPPVTPPMGVPSGADVAIVERPRVAAAKPTSTRADAPIDELRVVTRALAATALADGAAIDIERDVLAKLATKLGAPAPEPEDWKAWRPNELGRPPDPAATIAAMRVLALADGIADPGEARLIREFARAWGVALSDSGLPPYTTTQKVAAGWLAMFGR